MISNTIITTIYHVKYFIFMSLDVYSYSKAISYIPISLYDNYSVNRSFVSFKNIKI